MCFADNVGLAIKIMPGYAEYMVLSDEKLVLNCSNTPVQGALKWYRNDILLNSDTSANLEIRGKAESGDNVSILTYSPVSENRSGEYKCKSEVGTSPPSVAAEAKITVFDITGELCCRFQCLLGSVMFAKFAVTFPQHFLILYCTVICIYMFCC